MLGMAQRFKKFQTTLLILFFFAFFFKSSLATDQMNLMFAFVGDMRGWSFGKLAAPTSIVNTMMIFGYILVPMLYSKVKASYFVGGSLIAMGIGEAMIGLTTGYVPYCIGLFVLKAASDMFMQVALQTVITSWFITKRSWALGILTIGCPAGTAVFLPIMTAILNESTIGPAFACVGAIVAIVGILALILIKNKPEDVGLQADGIERTGEEMAAIAEAEKDVGDMKYTFILSRPQTWLIIIGMGGISFAMMGILTTILQCLMEVGFSQTVSSLLITLAAVGGMGMSYLWGWVDDKLGTHKGFATLCLTYAAACLLLFFGCKYHFKPAGFLGVLGYASVTGGVPNFQPSMIAYVYGRKNFLRANTCIMPFYSIMAGYAIQVMAWFGDVFHTFAGAYLGCVILCVISAVALLACKKTYDPERLTLQQLGKAK